ncbi:hypothetical protein DICVIV_10967 [Dictyocaulus viviparus]|uniref:Uncharacterized protein n=1 Tax=Dictyocaulus viviparus TaxID=29172 RepID=A0A0D8XH13_DICVI|nr:hypothetical protein DICVIV_10967 [Dictyocaulus viviparus]
MAPPRQRKQVNPPVQLVGPQTGGGVSTIADDTSASIAGVVVSVHPVWPEMQFTQGELFFECTLFLYSKFHLINPYFLSCVGLLLGWRVTKCFWKTRVGTLEYCDV